jgi:hypothetical protein
VASEPPGYDAARFLRALPAAEAPALVRELGGWWDPSPSQRILFAMTLSWPTARGAGDRPGGPFVGAVVVGWAGEWDELRVLGMAARSPRAAQALARAADVGVIAHGQDFLRWDLLPRDYWELLRGERLRPPPEQHLMADQLTAPVRRLLERCRGLTDQSALRLGQSWSDLRLEEGLAEARRRAAVVSPVSLRETAAAELQVVEAEHRAAGRELAAQACRLVEYPLLALLADHQLPPADRHRLLCSWEGPPLLPPEERPAVVEALARRFKELGPPRQPTRRALVYAHHDDPPMLGTATPQRQRALAALREEAGPLRRFWEERGRRLNNLVGDPALAVLAGERLSYDDRSLLYGPWLAAVEYGLTVESYRPPAQRPPA